MFIEMSTVQGKTSLNAESHIEYSEFVLEDLNKSFSNVVALIGYKCSTNKSSADKVDVTLLGRTSHRFFLAVKSLLEKWEYIIEDVNNILLKLHPTIVPAEVRIHTHLLAILNIKKRSGARRFRGLSDRSISKHSNHIFM